MKKLILLLLFIPIFSIGQGIIPLSSDEYAKESFFKFDNTLSFSESVPDNYSLEKFVPPVKKQIGGTCTGFSAIYYGLSTQFNIQLNITNKIDKNGHSFDPYYAYSYLSDNEMNSCNDGNLLKDVLTLLVNNGAKKQFFNPHLSCDSKIEVLEENILKKVTSPYSVSEYLAIPLEDKEKAVLYTKTLLRDNYPIIIGIETTNSLLDVEKDGVYSYDEQEDFDISHSVTIVGYDNLINGGSFRVVNSWGDEWGDGGYFWLRYKDFEKLVSEAYVMNINEKIEIIDNQFAFENYKRVNLGDDGFYEGEYENNMFNGQGIWSFENDEGRMNVIGNWNDNLMDGFFIIINDENEIFDAIYKDGEYVEDKLGFGENENEEELKKKKKFKEYWAKYGGKKKIRRSKTIILKPKT